ncbi:MAG TPA: xanthine dehydrogenase family protein subunit M [Ktedonobacteraceae bacterium]|nr:xanthine dehydrogenase family protein subunit M [Ktedonobacteraceae bacterium]
MSVPAAFDYYPATSVDEAISLLQQHGEDAKLLAGGHSLLPMMKLRLAQPGVLIDIGRIQGLSYIREDNGVVAVGALTTYATLARSDVIRQHFASLSDAASVIGDPQVRNRGTIGGAVSHADPAADMTAIVMALKADIVVKGPNGERTIKADDFFVDVFTTALEQGEIVTELRFAIPPAHTGSAYMKLENKASHYAVVGCAAVITLGQDGTCSAASLAITGASVKPTRASATESALVGKQLDDATVAEAASHAADDLELVSDIHGSQAYRGDMTKVMMRRAIQKAAERAQ